MMGTLGGLKVGNELGWIREVRIVGAIFSRSHCGAGGCGGGKLAVDKYSLSAYVPGGGGGSAGAGLMGT